MIQKQSIIIVVSPPPGVFLLPACWRPYGWRSLPRPLPEQTVSRPVGGGGRWWSVQLAGPVVTRQPEAPPPRRESQGRDELTERERDRWCQLFPLLLPCFLPSVFPLTFPLSSPPPAVSISLVVWGWGGGGRRARWNGSCRSCRRLIDRCCRGGAYVGWRRGEQSLGWRRQTHTFDLKYLEVCFYLWDKIYKRFRLNKDLRIQSGSVLFKSDRSRHWTSCSVCVCVCVCVCVYRCVSSVSLAVELSAARCLSSVCRFPPAASSDLWPTPAALIHTHTHTHTHTHKLMN